MSYRSTYRSWNKLALNLKTEEPEGNDLSYKDRQKPRRESWSPPQRGRGTRGRGTWYIDNRPQNRRRNTMPNSWENYQEFNHHADNDEPSDFKPLEDNPISEEPRNLPDWPVNDYNDLKSKENNENNHDDSKIKEINDSDHNGLKENNDNDHKDEPLSLNRKNYSSSYNIYRPPRSKSTSYIKEHWRSSSSSDDGSQSRGYSNGTSKKYEPEIYKAQWNNSWERDSINNEPDRAWVHDKFESLESDSDPKNKRDASTQVSPSDINDETLKNDNDIATFSKEINEPESPEDSKKLAASAEFPKEITIKFSELALKDSDAEDDSIATPEAESGMNSEATPEITPETTPVTPKDEELPMLINLDEDDNAGIQPIQPKISEDLLTLLTLDWPGYQKKLIEAELRLSMEQPSKMHNKPTLHKLDMGLKDFDSLL